MMRPRTAGLLFFLGAIVLSPQQLAGAATGKPEVSEALSRQILGRLQTGATVSFVKEGGAWGIDINGGSAPHILQHQPARLEIYQGGPQDVAAGYSSVRQAQGAVTASADISRGAGVTFHLEDRWSIKNGALWLHRQVHVTGSAEGGFGSSVVFSTTPETGWSDVDFLAPSKLYGDPSFDGPMSPGSLLHHAAKRFSMREMALTAPYFALHFRGGHSITVLDPAPKGGTTAEEAAAPSDTVLIDDRFNFGALGARDTGNGVDFGYWLPGTIDDFLNLDRVARPAAGVSPGYAPALLTAEGAYVPPPPPNVKPVWRRRYSPIKQGLTQEYDVAFRFGQGETFPATIRNSFRWAWDILKPAVNYVDIDYIRRVSVDVLSGRVLTIEGRTGIPYLLEARTGEYRNRSDAKRAAMGFCARNIEIADEFLKEAEREPGTARSEKLRQQGLAIIETFVRLLPMAPPAGDGFDIFTGQIIPASWSVGQQPLLTISTDMRSLVLAYEREKARGIDHPAWLAWARSYADWLLTQQHQDGSFPRAWKPGTAAVFNPSPSASYGPIVLFVPLARVTGDYKYSDAAIRAGDFVWRNYGAKGNYQGGAVDASSARLLTDKEGGMAAMDAFMALYEASHQPKWLSRALSAADYTESWIWIWNVPLPGGASDKEMRWRNGSMVGLQEITANGPGLGVSGDEYLDWAVTLYAKAYKYSGDAHYRDVAQILLHNTKAKVATPKDTYDFVGPGWEQESWSGDHGKWLPWLAANHLNGIMTLQEFDPELYRQLAAKPH